MSTAFTKHLRNAGIVAATLATAACSGGGQNGSPAIPTTSSQALSSTAQQNYSAARMPASIVSTAASTSTAYQTAILGDHPSAFFPLDDTGSKAVSMVDSSLAGTFGSNVSHAGAPLTTDGKASATFAAGAFDPTRVIEFAPSAELAPANTVSIEFWMKLTQLNTTGQVVPIISYGSQASTFPYEVSILPRNTLKFAIRGGAPYYIWGYEETQTLVAGKTYHIVATYDGITEHMYVNGLQTLSVKANGPLQYGAVASSPNGLTIGGEVGTGRSVVGASISDVAIYPTILSQATANRHYTAGITSAAPAATPAPVAPTPVPAPPAPTPIPGAVNEAPKSVFAFEDSIGFDSHFNYYSSPYFINLAKDATLLEQLPAHHLRDGGTGETAVMNELCSAGTLHSLGFPLNVTAAQITQQLNAQNPACVDYVEPANEADNTGNANWASQMMAEMKTIYTTVKSNPAFSKITVLGPGLANYGHYSLLPGIAQYSDAASFHDGQCDGSPMTTHYPNVAANYNGLKALYSSTKPVWTTEFTVANTPALSFCAVSMETAAKYAPRQFLTRFNLGMPRSYMNEFSQQPALGGWGVLGVVDQNGNPLAPYSGIHSLLAALPSGQSASTSLSNLSYALTGTTANVDHTLLQAADGTYYMVIWAEVDSWNVKSKADIAVTPQAVTLAIPASVKRITISAPQSNYTMSTTSLTPMGGKVPFSVTDAPMVVSFHL